MQIVNSILLRNFKSHLFLNKMYGFILAIIFLAFNSGCKQLGYQGGDVVTEFKGVEEATALSPTTINLSWSQSSRFSEFRIYRQGINNHIATENFASTWVKGLIPGTSYDFAVTGVLNESGSEEGLDNFLNVKTFSTFSGISADNLTVKSSTRVDLNWSMADETISYSVYSKIFGESWDFSTPIATIDGDNKFVSTGLKGGTRYCFFVVANYLDTTSEPSLIDTAAVDEASPCVVTETDLPNLPDVIVNEISPGSYPWFVAQGGDSTYSIDVYRASDDLLIASRIGNGSFKSFESIEPGKHEYYSIVKNETSLQAQVTVKISDPNLTKSKSRNIKSTGSSNALFPNVFAGGKGVQNFGQKLATGDFNCDGLPDIAVSAPTASPIITPRHYDTLGSVVIYYSYDPPPYIDPDEGIVDPPPSLKIDLTPTETAVFPNPQLVYFPVTQAGVGFGRSLAVGNANGDCYYRDSTSPLSASCDSLYSTHAGTYNISKIKTCDDLAISNNTNEVFVLYADPSIGLVSGSGSESFGKDELTCDPSSSTCLAVRYTASNSYDFGTALSFGDFNNDGFDDLAVGGRDSSDNNMGRVTILRGSSLGIYPLSSTKSFPPISSTAISSGGLIDNTAFVAVNGPEGFGDSLTSAYNSRSCPSGHANYQYRKDAPASDEYGYDFGKCDDLVIGVPYRMNSQGSIITCKGTLPLISDGGQPDKQRILSWTCKEHIPAELYGLSSNYGHSLIGAKNMNGYPLDNHVGTTPPYPNVTGAVFVGAPRATVSGFTNAGKVYGYYITPQSINHDIGGIQGILGTGQHTVNAQNSIACNPQNNNVTTGSLKHCEHQAIYNTPAQAGSRFGDTISTIPDLQDVTRGLPSLAVAAPYRDVLKSDGSETIDNAGIVYVFRPDTSTYGIDSGSQITESQSSDNVSTSCSNNCTWYSGGVSPFGPSLVYPLDLNMDANFGLGGAIGGDFNADGTGDLITSAPNYQSGDAMDNGAIFGFNSNGTFSASENSFDLFSDINFSKELNYHFERAKVIGDVNGDGYDEVLTHIQAGGRYKVVLFYGSSTGLVTTPEASLSPIGLSPLLIEIATQGNSFGKEFHRIGSVNGDVYDDILIIGTRESFIFYGSFSGLISNAEPHISPNGKNPLSFAKYDMGNNSITLHQENHNPARNETNLVYEATNQYVAHGDFNDDGYGDMAISRDLSTVLPSDQNVELTTLGLLATYSNSNDGLVFIIYGSENGPQTNRVTGKITIDDGGGVTTQDVVANNPCSAGSNPVCKIQVLANINGDSNSFGFSVAGLPSIEEQQGERYDELLVGDPTYNTNNGVVYVYKGSSTGLNPVPLQTLVPKNNSNKFGYNVSHIGDINNDTFPDIAITAPQTAGGNPGYLYIFYGSIIESKGAFFGAGALASTNYWSTGQAVNAPYADVALPYPQIIQPTNVSTTEYFGYGLSSAGDFNNDGYKDVIINVPGGTYDLEVTQPETGYLIVYFGSSLGIQSQQAPTVTPTCYSGTNPLCNPYQIYLPEREEYEHTFISNTPIGDINGDGLIDIVIGGPGRQHPGGQAYSVGVIYVLY